MLRKYWPFIFLIILLVVGGAAYKKMQDYKAQQRARIAAMQQKAEEVQVTIIEGWTLEQMATRFEEAELFSAKEFLDSAKDFDTSNFPLIQKPARTTLEGYLFPDTYRFAKGAKPADVIIKMLENFSRRVGTLGVTSAGNDFAIPGFEGLRPTGGDNIAGLSLYDIITLASIVEREGGGSGPMSLTEERALIAGVFYNRLMIGQGLESDATVNYITGKKTPGVSISDTQINSPYNTYRYAGLPPGPIGAPSLGSIQATLKPIKSDFYYFLHRQPSGEVVFSKTFAEHVQARQ
ncbi:MAG TPA: endolytic transglycosylase MltG [Candidatus Doudnabacteria bacterium]|nr:endolytic transglycosylase MltG [Candidatus Doudnabacteria bacterium]